MTTASPESGRTALVWSATEIFGQQGVNFLVQILLARLIAPSEFGLVAMLMIFLAVGRCLADSGFPHALIQKPNADQLDKSSVFYFNLLISLVLAGLLCAASGSIAAFYGQPQLQPLACWVSVMIVAQGLGSTHLALSRKDMQFRQRTVATVAASLLSGMIAVAMAVYGMGVWALATQMILMRLFQSVLLWCVFAWRPSWTFSITRLGKMFGFGSRLMMAALLGAIFDNIYLLVIGKFYAPTLTGHYAFAKRVQMFPAQNLNQVFCQVAFPLLSRRQHDTDLLRGTLRKFIKTSALLVMPLMSILAGLANPLFHAVLGPQWLPAVPYFRLLCVLGLLLPIHALNLQLLLAIGRGELYFRLALLKRATTVINLAITASISMLWLIRGEVIVSLFSLWINSYFTGRLLDYGAVRQLADIQRTLILSAVEFALCIAWTRWSTWEAWPSLIVGLVISLSVWAAFVWIFERWVMHSIREIYSSMVIGNATTTP